MSRDLEIAIVEAAGAEGLSGAGVIIDVLRAFTTAAFAFDAGAGEILLASTVEEAFALRRRYPDALLMGESGGYPIEGFDLGNSPSQLGGVALSGKRLIQRTTAGTRAALAAREAELLMVGSFVCASATVEYLVRHAPARATLVLSGRRDRFAGDDDAACADLLAARLRSGASSVDPAPFLDRCRQSSGAAKFLDPDKPAFPLADLELALELDRFDFAMIATPRDGTLVVHRAG